jgi:uncharacterized protein YuzE
MSSSFPHVRYDEVGNILYIRVAAGKIADSDVKDNMVIDYAKNGKILGIEILDFSLMDALKSPKAKRLIEALPR